VSPLHELTQSGLVRSFEHEVKVIRHQAETEYFYPMTFLGVSQQSQKASLREFPKPGSSRIFLYRPTIGTTGTFGTGVNL
jgi:hypothetical protein